MQTNTNGNSPRAGPDLLTFMAIQTERVFHDKHT